MFVPIHDDNPLKAISYQYVTLLLLALNVAIFIFEQIVVDDAMVASFGVVPRELMLAKLSGGHVINPAQALPIPERDTLFTYMFFHGDIVHLFGNMLFLWVFGDNVEDAMGHLRFFVFYIACGVFAGLAHAFMQPASTIPLIGASGAVAGVIAAYLMLHPHIRVWVLAMKVIPLRIPAYFALGAWVATQLVMVLAQVMTPRGAQADYVAWWAHIGGLLAGAALIFVMRRPGVPLFDRAVTSSAPTKSF